MSDVSFWRSTERAMDDFTGDGDVDRFRRRMKRLGHEADVIEDQIASIHPHLATRPGDSR